MYGRIKTLQAAILLGKWPNFEKEDEARDRIGIGAAYRCKLQVAGVTNSPQLAAGNPSVYAQCTVLVNHQTEVQAQLKDQGIPQLSATPRSSTNDQPCDAITASVAAVATHSLLKRPVDE